MKNLKYILSAMAFSLIANSAIAQNKVGINTTSPQATLDVEGNTRVTDISGGTSSLPVLMVEPDGKISKTASNEKLVHIVTIKVNMNGCQDYLQELDTKIPTDDYNIFITRGYMIGDETQKKDASGQDPINNKYAVGTYRIGSRDRAYNFLMAQPWVSPKNEGGTWKITADYWDGELHCQNANPMGNFYWVLELIVVKKSLMADEHRLDPGTNPEHGYLNFDINSGHTGAALVSPL